MAHVLSQINDVYMLVFYIIIIQFNIILKLYSLRSEIFTALLIITVCWNMTPYCFCNGRVAVSISKSSFDYPQYARNEVFQNVCNRLPVLNYV
jgi:hypothetical protein